MRPVELNYLFSPITTLKGVGIKTLSFFKKLLPTKEIDSGSQKIATPKIVDLIYHLPSGIIDRTQTIPLYNVKPGQIITTIVTIEEFIEPEQKSKPLRVRCYNPSGFITLLFFKFYEDYLKKILKVGEEVAISGRVDVFRDGLQMIHPDYIVPKEDIEKIRVFDRNYPLTGGLNQKFLKKTIDSALEKLPDLPEWIGEHTLKQENWDSWKNSIINIHNPKKDPEIDLDNKYRRRLSYDELLANQIAMRIVRRKIKTSDGRVTHINYSEDSLRSKLMQKLGFELTNGQKEILKDIYKDLSSPKKMLRLLQGDVGSGKTVIALISALAVVEDKKQAVIMVPTSILATQHYEWISKVCGDLNIKITLLTGKIRGKRREKILEDLKNGDVDILIGTHALIQNWVEFRDLALVVIDEQHKFGVLQRLALTKKGNKPDVLLMTATPIPRTLTLTIYGDTDISSLKEKPKNRLEIETKVIPSKKIAGIIEGLKRVISKGEKAYWICPLIEESPEMELQAVENRFFEFQKIFGKDKVGLVHGKIKTDEKDEIMENFANPEGKIKILVATTVVEVGVDVSDATVIVVENTERFGLSQLHQLRGRVGRGDKKSFCILLYERIGKKGFKRLSIMRETNDGFRIAEEDLKIRGAGEMLGTKQSGFPGYKVANLNCDYDLLNQASQDARLFLEKDFGMKSKRGEALRILLYLFGYDGGIGIGV